MFVSKAKYDDLERQYRDLKRLTKDFSELSERAHRYRTNVSTAIRNFDELDKDSNFSSLRKELPYFRDEVEASSDHDIHLHIAYLVETIRKLSSLLLEARSDAKSSNVAMEDVNRRVNDLQSYSDKTSSELRTLKTAFARQESQLSHANENLKRFQDNQDARQGAVLASTPLPDLVDEVVARLESKPENFENLLNSSAASIVQLLKTLREFGDRAEPFSRMGSFDDLRALSYTSDEAIRTAQYEMILKLYNEKIARLRAQDMAEEDKEESIQAMKRLRDRETELWANAEVVDG